MERGASNLQAPMLNTPLGGQLRLGGLAASGDSEKVLNNVQTNLLMKMTHVKVRKYKQLINSIFRFFKIL
jgi:hypothetical protein